MPVLLRRLAGATLLVLAFAPLHRLLRPEAAGPAGAATREAAETAWILGLSGGVIVLTFAWLLARMVPSRSPGTDPVERLAERMVRPSAPGFAAATGLLVAGLCTLIALVVHGGRPTSVDEMAQLLHAAALADGRLTVPLEGAPAAWVIQNGVVTEGGWASIYPPGHTLLLALGLWAGASWAVGPLLTGLGAACFTWSADRLLGPRTGRLAGLLLAVSPFWLLLGASHSSHAAAAAALSLVLLCGLRAESGSLAWALATGVAVGMAVTARPWTGLLCSTAILTTQWWRGASTIAPRLAGTLLGGLPFAALFLAWNQALFGSPLRLGYTVAFGPAHGLGLRTDPWGNEYGVVEAVGYLSADLLQLGIRLLESPLPALAVVGGALLFGPLGRGAGVFGAWAAAGVAAALAYWHHGTQFGPRMLYETVPGWVALFAASAALLLRRGTASTLGRLLRWTVLVTVAGGVALAPTALRSASGHGVSAPLPDPTGDSALVFVHGSWASRISARLVAAGMRRDSIETALRRNDVCAVDRYARWRRDDPPGIPAPPLSLEPRPGTPSGLRARELSPGNLVRVDPALAFDTRCLREARSDRFGTLELEEVAWRFPPLGGAVVMARDMGPAANLAVLDAVPRPAYVLLGVDEGPTLVRYAEGMELLWGGAAGEAAPNRR